ncbi:putative transporter [Devosia pacifica]|uniref:Transporter n=1 Tax=Devosia pacifica TaxID=1335967 RepID=A0A918RYG8_9HYPH|nr:putative transporter [Devosia pacifica]
MLAALAAYGLWGFLPILFRMLDGVPSTLIVAERILWSLVLVGVFLLIKRRLGEVIAVLRDRRRLLYVTVAALVLACNWLLYVWAVETEQLLEASFGYFINPLVNVALGMVLLGERQNRWQAVSIAIAVVGIGIQAAGLGNIPFIALGLALSFGLYGFFRKTAGVGATIGLFAETLVMAPIALVFVVVFTALHGTGPHADPQTFILLMLTGPATAVPLLLFAYAVQRLRLTTIGMFQYIAPSIQFLVAILMFGEALNEVRLISFALIWISLAVFTVDSVRQRRRRSSSAAA